MQSKFKILYRIGLAIEVFILGISYLLADNWGETFRLAARYSGRFSALVFIACSYLFITTKAKQRDKWFTSFIKLFALLHIIHFAFLAANVYLNDLPIVPIRLVGGALAYVLILIAPFRFSSWPVWLQYSFFFYVNIVMFLTYLSRVQGNFPGAGSSWNHYFGISFSILIFLGLIHKLSRRRK